jgi:prepilin-type N-terminal cleavage/methylation domain-containing protein
MPTRISNTSCSRDGFTLIEILAVLTILGILGMIAAPRVSGMISANRVERALDGLASDLTLARVRAVRENRSTTVRIDNNSRYVVFVVSPTPSAADTIKRVQVAKNYPGVTLSPATVSFDSRGLTTDATTLTATQAGRTRTLSVTGIGRIYRAY